MISKPIFFAAAFFSLLQSSFTFAALAPEQSDLREITPAKVTKHYVAYCALGMYLKAIDYVFKNGTPDEKKNVGGKVNLQVEAFSLSLDGRGDRDYLDLDDGSLNKISLSASSAPHDVYFEVSGTVGRTPVSGDVHLIYNTIWDAQAKRFISTCSPLVGTELDPTQIAMTLDATTSPSAKLLDFANGAQFDNATP
jgi:hypothetical protein